MSQRITVTAWKADVLQKMRQEYKEARQKGDRKAQEMTFQEWVDYRYPPRNSATSGNDA